MTRVAAATPNLAIEIKIEIKNRGLQQLFIVFSDYNKYNNI